VCLSFLLTYFEQIKFIIGLLILLLRYIFTEFVVARISEQNSTELVFQGFFFYERKK